MHVDKYICDRCKKEIAPETLPKVSIYSGIMPEDIKVSFVHDFRIKKFLSDPIEGHFCDSCLKQFMAWFKEV